MSIEPVKTTNQSYIEAQLVKCSPFPAGNASNGRLSIKIMGEHGKTNCTDIDVQAQKEIEQALFAMAFRKDRTMN